MPHHHEIGLEAGDEQQQQHADLREVADERQQRYRIGPGRRREYRPREDVEERRTEDQAGENFSEDRWLVDARGERAGELGRRDDEREDEDNLERMGQRRTPMGTAMRVGSPFGPPTPGLLA